MYSVNDIKYENGKYWVYQTENGSYEVYMIGITHSTRCAIIGIKGLEGLERAKKECDKRENSKN